VLPQAEYTEQHLPGPVTTDEDQQRTAQILSRAFGDGLLFSHEIEERLAGAYQAATVADLAAVTADLPAERLAAYECEEREQRLRLACQEERHAEVGSYLRVMTLLVLVWLGMAVFGGAWNPWPLWPALGWGIPLFLGRRRDTASASLSIP